MTLRRIIEMRLTLIAEYDPSLENTIDQQDLEYMASVVTKNMKNKLTVTIGESVEGSIKED